MDEKKEAQIVLRVPVEVKNALVKASQASGEKLTEWMLKRVEGAARFGPSNPPVLPMHVLPGRLVRNWHISTTVRSDAQVKHARWFANTVCSDKDSQDWQAAFDYAALDWLAANPAEPFWATGKWPDGARKYLGEDALTEARRALGLL